MISALSPMPSTLRRAPIFAFSDFRIPNSDFPQPYTLNLTPSTRCFILPTTIQYFCPLMT
jgi:hypothetical protein